MKNIILPKKNVTVKNEFDVFVKRLRLKNYRCY